METLDAQCAYLIGEGYSGALEDMLLAYYNTQNTATDTALYDAQYKFMVGLGGSGSLADMLFNRDSVFSTDSGEGIDYDAAWGSEYTEDWDINYTDTWT